MRQRCVHYTEQDSGTRVLYAPNQCDSLFWTGCFICYADYKVSKSRLREETAKAVLKFHSLCGVSYRPPNWRLVMASISLSFVSMLCRCTNLLYSRRSRRLRDQVSKLHVSDVYLSKNLQLKYHIFFQNACFMTELRFFKNIASYVLFYALCRLFWYQTWPEYIFPILFGIWIFKIAESIFII